MQAELVAIDKACTMDNTFHSVNMHQQSG